MSCVVSLPFYVFGISNRDFEPMIDAMRAHDPDLGRRSWLLLRDVDVGFGPDMSRVVDALVGAFGSTDIFGDDYPAFAEFSARLDWLRRDLTVAPLSISEPLRVAGEGGQSSQENLRAVLKGPGFEWLSLGYLLGVLLSELARLEKVPVDVIGQIDEKGVLDVSDLGLDDPVAAVRRTVDSILASDQGRDFSDPYSETAEERAFSELQEILASLS